MLTKDAEKALLVSTIAALPDSYLREILCNESSAIVRAIDQDLGYIDLAGQFLQFQENERQLNDLRHQRRELEGIVRDLNRQRDRLQDGLRELRSDARRLAGV